MAFASIICGLVGFVGFYICGRRILVFILQTLLESINLGYYTLVFQYNTQTQIIFLTILVILSWILIFLAFIFGKTATKSGKQNEYYWLAFIGYILGWIGVLVIAIGIATLIIFNMLHLFFVITNKTIISQNIFPLGNENLPMYHTSIIAMSLSLSFVIIINALAIFLGRKLGKRKKNLITT